jgi:hypothetical protein
MEMEEQRCIQGLAMKPDRKRPLEDLGIDDRIM